MQIIDIELVELKPYSKNQKKHDKEQIEKVARSIKELGFRQPLVVDKDNIIVIGHCRYESAKLLGLKTVPCIKADDLTEEQIKALRIADNKLNESDWIKDLLKEDLIDLNEQGFDITVTGFTLDTILKEEEKDDLVPFIPKEAKSKLGDVYQLGEHILIC